MDERLRGEVECRLVTTGRTSGQPRAIAIWFAWADGRVYLLSGGGTGSHWVRNLLADPRVRLVVGGVEHPATARLVAPDDPADATARAAFAAKYGTTGLKTWLRTALPVELTLEG